MEMYIHSYLNNKIKYFIIINQIYLYKHVTIFIFTQYNTYEFFQFTSILL